MSVISHTNEPVAASKLKFIDIGVNLIDPIFRGVYRGNRKHEDDLADVMKRSQAAGVKSAIITGGNLLESREAVQLAKELKLYATAGCHPTRSGEFEKYESGPQGYLQALDHLISTNLLGEGRIVAVGECGLDYDRTHFASPETQQLYFRMQLTLAKKYHLPLFLHSRAAHMDFVRILKEEGFGTDGGRGVGASGGVVHSFTGTPEEALEYTEMGFHISLNGCSLKTEDSLKAVKVVHLDKLLLETDAPWCSITSTHASKKHLASLPQSLSSLFSPPAKRPEQFVMGYPVKGRNEPSAIGNVAWVAHQVHGLSFENVMEKAWKNTIELFNLKELWD